MAIRVAAGAELHTEAPAGVTRPRLRVKDGQILEEIGLDDGVVVLQQLGLIAQR